MTVISYVVAALSTPPPPATASSIAPVHHHNPLSLQAANALRDLCDANRTALAPHIAAFGQLHAGLVGVPEVERAKVLQSIASVIQALNPEEGIESVSVSSPDRSR